MEKMKLHSPNLTQENIRKLMELFPNCVTEAEELSADYADERRLENKDNEESENLFGEAHPNNNLRKSAKSADKKLRMKIDFDLLRQELSESIVEGPQERYHLNWPGKREALLTANAPIAKTLRPCREESVDFDTTKNLFIEGDNLEALKLLQETYLGKVKMIYIDPPYNTGNDFIYEDDFSENAEEFLKRSSQKDEEGNRLIANTEANGRFHSDWLSMIYPRLKIARSLLTDDGALFVSADYHESSNLRKICDEIFGEKNFQADISWQKRYTRSNNTQDFTTVVEHILVYSRSDAFKVNLLPRTDEADGRYSNPDNDTRGPWKGASFLNPATPEQRPNLCYPITNPNSGSITTPTTNAWRRSKDEFERLQKDGLLYWGIDGNSPVPSIKMFLSDARGLTPVNFWEHSYAGNTDDGTRDVSSLFGNKVFDNPKPVQLMKRILEHATAADSTILDFFAGSASMAHATLEKNAEDGGKRRFIMVQIDEETPSDSTAHKVGFDTIAEISKERIRRAGKKISADYAEKRRLEEKEKSENLFSEADPKNNLRKSAKSADKDLDIGFRVLKIDSSNMADIYYTPDTIDQTQVDAFVDNIKPDRKPEDLLFQVLLDWGVDLSLPIRKEFIHPQITQMDADSKTEKNNLRESVKSADKKSFEVFFVDENALVACFDTGVNEELVKQLAEFEPLRVVFRDTGFVSDAVKINVEQIFKQMSPGTEVKSI